MSSMHRFGGLLYFPMPDGMIILRYEHRFISLHYFLMSNLFGMLGIGIGFNDNMVCDAEIYYSTVFIRKYGRIRYTATERKLRRFFCIRDK